MPCSLCPDHKINGSTKIVHLLLFLLLLPLHDIHALFDDHPLCRRNKTHLLNSSKVLLSSNHLIPTTQMENTLIKPMEKQ